MAKGHFNVLKGAYPSLSQIDRTLPVGDAVTGLVRGSALVVIAGVWKLTADDTPSHGVAGTPGPVVYFALQGQEQTDVQMAGGLTGLSCQMPLEVETDQYNGTPAVGDLLVGSTGGKVSVHADGETAIGIVTKSAYQRWINDKDGTPQGGFGNVISFSTAYLPDMDGV